MTSKQTILAILLLTLSLTCIGCVENTQADPDTTINAQSVEEYDLAAANNDFAFDLYSELQDGGDENLLISPYSIFTAMAICYDGSAGNTQEEMANVFYYPMDRSVLRLSAKDYIHTINNDPDEYELTTANALWLRKGVQLKPEYESAVENYYSGKIEELDFANDPKGSIDTINKWIEEKTNNKIKDVLNSDAIDGSKAMVITNAIYFNGKWINEFPEENTKKEYFHPSEGQQSSVDMMSTSGFYNYGESSKAHIIELPYKGDDLSMYVVLPENADIGSFESSFTLNEYNSLKMNMNTDHEVNLWLPKFKFESTTQLSDTLAGMGMTDAFSNANFSGINEEADLTISRVIHKAVIDVQEKGTEAATATAVVAEDGLSYNQPVIKEFRADHPFMFFIEDKRTGCILFMGKVEHPEYDEVTPE
ncbi:serpin [Methanococcoides methylutens]|uniref:Serpin n=1 Tax=Methanococcoides methylutens TaxID=2226 RepID=A0A099SZY5_METMT|nr:serpin family protein [Methanococcoides methylutens]KGK98234.1 serpin [Methanococcoides methylutens]